MKRFSADYYTQGLDQGNIVVLAQCITLAESMKSSDQVLANQILDHALKKKNNAIRIGITGTPGVGKSSFIEGFGNYLIDQGKKLAVLAVDPSSQKTGGSILGDKTRMETLSRHPDAFIRPSASGSTLGGVNNRTREAILLCEAAGYDAVIVETVGVGQSETLVHGMVDFFLLMIQPGSGDDLQGIKKGIMEMADGIVINKADGDQKKLANTSKVDLLTALHLFAPDGSGWNTQVKLCSALEKTGFAEVWQMITAYEDKMTQNGVLEKLRTNQNVQWFEDRVNLEMLKYLAAQNGIKQLLDGLKEKVRSNDLTVTAAINQVFDQIKKNVI